jgi:hypothetical protein
MVSIWWVVLAFLVGGFAGLLAFSLIGMARREGERAVKAEKMVPHDDLGTLKLDRNWMGKHYWSATFE